jgi:hypothetical protein
VRDRMRLFVSSRLSAMFRAKFFSATLVALALIASNVFAVASAFQTFQFKSEVMRSKKVFKERCLFTFTVLVKILESLSQLRLEQPALPPWLMRF